ncbi:hypothetical protein [Halorientalis regularis]|jgi:hypothetical protein|uniref:hypothetical protein n=1 Tax=Halorientalis regularis TaxID=660518 RepID=UPI001113C514|nr:hypothetical protein [Halorientalis regularis]
MSREPLKKAPSPHMISALIPRQFNCYINSKNGSLVDVFVISTRGFVGMKKTKLLNRLPQPKTQPVIQARL